MKKIIVIVNKENEVAHKIFDNILDAVIYDWELRMQGYKSRIENY